MDSLHVCGTPQASSKTSSRSASPCRPRHHHQQQQQQQQSPQQSQQQSQEQSGGGGSGSIDSGKSHDGVTPSTNNSNNRSRQRSPTTSRHRSPTHHRPLNNPPSSINLNINVNMEDPTTPHKSTSEREQHPEDTPNTTANLELPDDSEVCFSSFLSNGSSEHVQYDETDTNTAKALAAIEHLNKKIIRVRESIRMEQTMRDENVNEYLKLAANADKQQLQRIKAVFEKKNQKSAHLISQLQKKLDSYTKRLRELEAGGSGAAPHRPPREVLRDMGQGLKNVGGNIRDGITGFSGSVMSKPREFAHLIKNKFGSADNINHLSTWYVGGGSGSGGGGGGSSEGGVASGPESTNNSTVVGGTNTSNGGDKQQPHHGSATLPGGCTLTSGASQGSVGHGAKFPSDEGSECSSVTSESLPGYHGRNQEGGSQGVYSLKPIFAELQERREDYERLREKIEGYKNLQQEVQYLSSALQEERFRLERLEEQINDLTELHQNEVENLKQALADMEEKVQYQSEERLRDIHEMLEHCQTKMQKMEHQALQQQQYVTLEGIDNSNARALVVKLINVVLTVLQVVLLLVATVAGITMPFLRTSDLDVDVQNIMITSHRAKLVRFLSTIMVVFAILFVLKQWPEVRDIGSHVMHHIKEMLDPVK